MFIFKTNAVGCRWHWRTCWWHWLCATQCRSASPPASGRRLNKMRKAWLRWRSEGCSTRQQVRTRRPWWRLAQGQVTMVVAGGCILFSFIICKHNIQGSKIIIIITAYRQKRASEADGKKKLKYNGLMRWYGQIRLVCIRLLLHIVSQVPFWLVSILYVLWAPM